MEEYRRLENFCAIQHGFGDDGMCRRVLVGWGDRWRLYKGCLPGIACNLVIALSMASPASTGRVINLACLLLELSLTRTLEGW